MLTIDFHAHILPGCDHGSRDLKTSLQQVHLAKDAGVDVICATSHFYAHQESVDDFLQRRNSAFETLRGRLGADDPGIRLGAEVLAFAGIERMPGVEKLCLAGTDLILIEMPFIDWDEAVIESVLELSEKPDLRVVLAHIDRYKPADVDRLLGEGLMAQLNVEKLSGLLLKRDLKEWLEQERVFAFGSDIHGCDTGYRDWLRAKKYRAKYWDEVMEKTNRLLG